MHRTRIIKRIVDTAMTVSMLFLTARQVTGDKYHEWFGIFMLLLFLLHNYMNRKWYQNLWKGSYSIRRILWTIINFFLLSAILLTGYSGMVMSRYVFASWDPGIGTLSARNLHLAGSYWSFVLMSCHLGLHWGMVVSSIQKKTKNPKILWNCLRTGAAIFAVYGAVCFYRNQIWSYMTLKNIFVFLDYEKAPLLILIENAAMMGTFVFLTYYLMKGLMRWKKEK